MDKSTIEQQDTYLDVLVSIEKDMEAYQETNVIFALPETEERFEELQKTTDFKKVVWRRLYSLGYASSAELKKKKRRGPRSRGSQSVEKQYKQTVIKFQKDAGTNQDGWVGLETWESMQELFTFEHDSNLEKWFMPKYKKIFNRAIHLRLMMLGVVDKPNGLNRATGNDEALAQGISKWIELLKQMKVTDPNNYVTYINYLFDIDKLTKLVAVNIEELRLLPLSLEGRIEITAAEVFRFQKSLLKIELWLYGFEGIQPGNRGANCKVQYLPQEKREKRKSSLSVAMSDFLDEFEVDVTKTIRNDESELIKLSLIQLAQLDDEETREANAHKRSELLTKRIEMLPPKQHEKLTTNMKSSGFGDWLFDGIKRIYRWLKNSIVGVFDFMKESATNAAKLLKKLATSAKRVASEAYSFVRRGFKVLIDGFNFLSKAEWQAHKRLENNAVFIRKSYDMDTLVFISDNATPEQLSIFTTVFTKVKVRVRAAMALVNFIIDEVFNMFKKTAISGPVAIVSLLVRIYRMRDSDTFNLLKEAYDTYE